MSIIGKKFETDLYGKWEIVTILDKFYDHHYFVINDFQEVRTLPAEKLKRLIVQTVKLPVVDPDKVDKSIS